MGLLGLLVRTCNTLGSSSTVCSSQTLQELCVVQGRSSWHKIAENSKARYGQRRRGGAGPVSGGKKVPRRSPVGSRQRRSARPFTNGLAAQHSGKAATTRRAPRSRTKSTAGRGLITEFVRADKANQVTSATLLSPTLVTSPGSGPVSRWISRSRYWRLNLAWARAGEGRES